MSVMFMIENDAVATIENYATAAFEQTGGVGNLTQSGSIFTLDFGVAIAGFGRTADLGLFNAASAPADWIDGSLVASGDAVFTNSGTGGFGDIVAGGDAGLQITFASANPGSIPRPSSSTEPTTTAPAPRWP